MKKDEKKILIKLSGGALSSGDEKYIEGTLENTARSIKEIQGRGYQIALVVGGGNLFRGRDLTGKLSVRRPTADYIGMLATVQNALVLRDYFESQGLEVRVLSAISMPQICESYIPQRALRHMTKGRVVIFAGGLGNPYFTTDSAAAQRALELNCSMLIMAKDGVDGVYDNDPKTSESAKKINNLTSSRILKDNLQVADVAAISLARENKLPIKVVSMSNLTHFDNDSIGSIINPD